MWIGSASGAGKAGRSGLEVWQKKAADERRRRGDQAERGRKTRNGGPERLFLLQAATHFKSSATHLAPLGLAALPPLFWSNSNQRQRKGGTMMPFPAGD
jgi:hypothetical protein